jgi:hypothetical protein
MSDRDPDQKPTQYAVDDWENAARLFDGLTVRLARKLDRPEDSQPEVAPHVGVFASARDRDRAGRLHTEFAPVAKELGRALATSGFSLLTGGCPGIVERAQEAFTHHRLDPTRQRSVGVRIMALEFEEPENPHLDITIRAPTFGARLELMHRFCDGCIILPGGLGSLLEFANFLQYAQVARQHRGMPICLLPGWFWNPMKDLFERMRAYHTVSPENGDLAHLHWVDDVESAVRIILNHNGNRDKVVRTRGGTPR